MTKLYIIGNGFDKYHKLPTGYDDFCLYVTNNHEDIDNIFAEYFRLNTNECDLWANFETDLNTFQWKIFFDDINNLDPLDEKFRPSFVFSLEDELTEETDRLVDAIKVVFGDWLSQISLDSINKKLDFEEESVFLNFNYTMTLEEVYKVSDDKIFHIHGSIEQDQDSLIFGHNKEIPIIPELDENGDSNRTVFTDSENVAKHPLYAFQKPVADIISNNQDFFYKIRDIDEVIIMGHSLNSIDIPYFKEIIKQTKSSITWKVSFYTDDEKVERLKILQKLGVRKSKIELFSMG